MRHYRSIFTAILLTTSTFTFAQNSAAVKMPMNDETQIITFDKVQELANVSQAELYRRGLNWCMTYYKNPNDVIRERDSLDGKIVCKARFKISNPPNKDGLETDAGLVQYTLTLLFKEGRYRYTLTDLNWKQQSYYAIERWMDTGNQYYKPEFDHYLKLTDEYVKKTVKDLEQAMKTSEKVKADDW